MSQRKRRPTAIAADDSVFVGGTYRTGTDKIEQTASDVSSMEDDPEQRRQNYEDSGAWYAGLVGDLYN